MSGAALVLCKSCKPQFNMSDIMSVCFLRLMTGRGGVCRCVTHRRRVSRQVESWGTVHKKKKKSTRLVLFIFEIETYWKSSGIVEGRASMMSLEPTSRQKWLFCSHLFRRWCLTQVNGEESHLPKLSGVLKQWKGEKRIQVICLEVVLWPLYRTLTPSELKLI